MQFSRTTIECGQYFQSQWSGTAVVKPEMFGNIFTSYDNYSYKQFKNDSSIYHYEYLRWPGGSITEDPDKYSLSSPNLLTTLSGTSGQSFVEILHDAYVTGLAMSLIIPTVRYMNPTANAETKLSLIEQSQTEFAAFLIKLTSGTFGQIPANFTLEIGNESSWIGWETGDYGKLANALLTTFRQIESTAAIAGHPFDIKIAVQMAAGSNQAIVFRQISEENLRVVDGFVRHSGLTESLDGVESSDGSQSGGYDLSYQLTRVSNVNKYWVKAFETVGLVAPKLNILDTAWSVGPESTKLTPAELESYDIGARQGVSTITLFSQMIAAGSDMAAVWGAVGSNPNRYFWHGKDEPVTHGGEALRLLSESLKGTTLLAGKLDTNNNWIRSGTNYDTVTFEDDGKIVVFLTSGDISGDGLTVTIDLDKISNLGGAIFEAIGTENLDDLRSNQRPADPQLGEVVIQTDGRFSYTFTQPYQVVRVVISKFPGVDPTDLLESREPNDIFFGTSDDDFINGADGQNFIFGGLGFDITSWQDSSNSVSINLSTNKAIIDSNITTIINVEGVSGSEYSDVLIGSALSNRLSGLSGADSIDGLAGKDSLFGGDGNDTLVGGADNDSVYGGGGNDFLIGGTDQDLLEGGAGNDLLVGGTGADWASFAGANPVTVDLSITSAQNTGCGFDTLVSIENIMSDSGSDRLLGNQLNNFFCSNAGNDSLYGGGGNDTFEGGSGNDILDGGAGDDFVNFRGSSPVNVNLSNLSPQNTGYGVDSLTNIENVSSGNGSDFLSGNSYANLLAGNAGNDSILGLDGNDTLFGGEGNDSLNGGAGNDTLDGGLGNDWIFLTGGASFVIQLSVRSAQDTGYGMDTIIDIENISSGSGHDKLTGSAANNSIFGNIGNDTIYGWGGNDSIYGGDGNDVIGGNSGDDFIFGDKGNDRIEGNMGCDTFIFARGSQIDEILDYSNDDSIDVSGFSYSAGYVGMMKNCSRQVGGDVQIDFGSGDLLIIKNTYLASLDQADFVF